MNEIAPVSEVRRPPYPAKIATAINTVMTKVTGVEKGGENTHQSYKYARMSDLLVLLQPAMADAGLFVIQNEVSHGIVEGKANSVMEATYEFGLFHKDGDEWPDRPRITGMSLAVSANGKFDDKSLNKCGTSARKYFFLGLFQIPTLDEDADDADKGDSERGGGQQRHEPRSQAREPAPAAAPTVLPPAAQTFPAGAHSTPENWKVWCEQMAADASAAPDRTWLDRFFALNEPGIAALGQVSDARKLWLINHFTRVSNNLPDHA